MGVFGCHRGSPASREQYLELPETPPNSPLRLAFSYCLFSALLFTMSAVYVEEFTCVCVRRGVGAFGGVPCVLSQVGNKF